MNAYTLATKSRLIDATEVGELFGRGRHWFRKSRTRKRLYKNGFPLPVERARWLRTAVEAWLERMGTQRAAPEGRPPAEGRP